MDNQISVVELLSNVSKLNTRDFEIFLIEIQSLYSQKITATSTVTENKLLKQIKSRLISSKQIRFEYLIARRDARTINEQEFSELLILTDAIEKSDLLRLKRIAKLADLKRMTLPEVVHFYNLQPMAHG